MKALQERKTLQEEILRWFDRNGRRNLPWQKPKTPYRVWVSEIMLQQTQVETALPYFLKFMERFPTVEALAEARIDEVLEVWQGLGYYRRAHLLHRAARAIVQRGGFAETVEAWQELPGIGRSTAGAIVSLAFNRPAPVLDGNVKRLWCRLFGIEGWPHLPEVERKLWEISRTMLPPTRAADWTQALMDLGALVCRPRAPLCDRCPLRRACEAFKRGLVERLPTPKPKSHKPERRVFWLLLLNEHGEVYLERRPPYGLWSGLWTLPEFESREAALAHLRPFPGTVRQLPPGKHTFTHFGLRFYPLLVEIGEGGEVREGEGGWFPLDRLPPLPRPVQRLLKSLGQRQEKNTVQEDLWPGK